MVLIHGQIVYDQEVDTLNQAHAEQREEEKQNSEQKMNEVQVRQGSTPGANGLHRPTAESSRRRIDSLQNFTIVNILIFLRTTMEVHTASDLPTLIFHFTFSSFHSGFHRWCQIDDTRSKARVTRVSSYSIWVIPGK